MFLSLVTVLLVPLFALDCGGEENITPVPELKGGQEAKMIEISTDDFTSQNPITRQVEFIRPGSLIVSLGSNPTTGFQWGDAIIADATVVTQASRNFVEPQAGTVGAPGKDVWVFDSLKTGTTTIAFSYGRSWEGGEKDAWTLTVSVTVK